MDTENVDVDERCVVCNDVATGFHYRCMTCEGCKGFFRRTIQKNLQYSCKGNGKCVVDKSTRNQCQKCRYKKCKDAGMAVDLVLNDNQRVAKRQLIECNRQKRKLEQMLQKLRRSADELWRVDEKQQSELVNNVTGAYCATLDVERRPFSDWKLDENEQTLLERLVNPFLCRAIAFARNIQPFSQLSVADQSALLRANWGLPVLLLLCLQYDQDNDALILPDGRILVINENIDSGDNAQIEQIIELLRPLLPCAAQLARLQIDNTEAALIAALTLINPEDQCVADLDTVHRAQDQLLTCLETYERTTALQNLASPSSPEPTTSNELSRNNEPHPLALILATKRWPKLVAVIGEMRYVGGKVASRLTECKLARPLATLLGTIV